MDELLLTLLSVFSSNKIEKLAEICIDCIVQVVGDWNNLGI